MTPRVCVQQVGAKLSDASLRGTMLASDLRATAGIRGPLRSQQQLISCEVLAQALQNPSFCTQQLLVPSVLHYEILNISSVDKEVAQKRIQRR